MDLLLKVYMLSVVVQLIYATHVLIKKQNQITKTMIIMSKSEKFKNMPIKWFSFLFELGVVLVSLFRILTPVLNTYNCIKLFKRL